jgi:hypothetical protein
VTMRLKVNQMSHLLKGLCSTCMKKLNKSTNIVMVGNTTPKIQTGYMHTGNCMLLQLNKIRWTTNKSDIVFFILVNKSQIGVKVCNRRCFRLLDCICPYLMHVFQFP